MATEQEKWTRRSFLLRVGALPPVETKGRDCVVTSRQSVSGRAVVLTVKMSDGPARSRRQLGGYECWLFSQRTRVWLPAPTQWLRSICNSSTRGSSASPGLRQKKEQKEKQIFVFPQTLKTIYYYFKFFNVYGFLKALLFICMCVCPCEYVSVCVYVCPRKPEEDFSSPRVRIIVSCEPPVWMQGTELRSSAEVNTLAHWASLAPCVGCFACLCVCASHVCLVPVEAKRGGWIPLGLELWTVVSCCVGMKPQFSYSLSLL